VQLCLRVNKCNVDVMAWTLCILQLAHAIPSLKLAYCRVVKKKQYTNYNATSDTKQAAFLVFSTEFEYLVM
jgi:hypothetical protein